MAKRMQGHYDDILNTDTPQANIDPADAKRLELKKKQVLRAKSTYQKYCREFIDLWMEVKGSNKGRFKKKNKSAA